MSDTSLIRALYDAGVVQFGTFTLKSGKTSSIYINLRKIISYPALLRQIAASMWEKAAHCQFDLICGVPYTALPIATCLSLDHHLPMVMRRKEKKDYGTKQMIEGVYTNGQCCLIIEDVITTGGSIVETANDLSEAGINVQDIIVLIDREQGGKALLEKNYRVHTLLTLSTILAALRDADYINETERHLIEKLIEERAA
jgi:orotate phosphoribosyltransferase